MMSRKRQKGFTLLEILVVVLILGLLISIAAPRLLGGEDDAKVVKADIVADNGVIHVIDSVVLPK